MNAAERQGIVTSVFDSVRGRPRAVREARSTTSRQNVPGEDWETYISAQAAQSYQPFIDSGLSIDWWVTALFERVDGMS